MASLTQPNPGMAPGRRGARALLTLTACAILLAGCGASLQDELASGIGSQPAGAAPADVVTVPEKGETVTASRAAAPGAGSDVGAAEPGRMASPAASPVASRPPSAVNAPVRTAALRHPTEAAATPATAAVRLPASAASLTAVAEPGHKAYRIGPLDVLTITVFRVPELSAEVQVADTGTINLPLIGEVTAAGRTAKDVETDVTARLGEKYLQNPQVTVFIKEYNAQRVTVNGAVKKPGVFPLKGRTTLMQLISMAEGLDHNRASSNVVVFRQADGKRSAARFDLDTIHDGTAPDPTLEPGDVVVVDDSSAKILWNNLMRAIPITHVFTAIL